MLFFLLRVVLLKEETGAIKNPCWHYPFPIVSRTPVVLVTGEFVIHCTNSTPLACIAHYVSRLVEKHFHCQHLRHNKFYVTKYTEYSYRYFSLGLQRVNLLRKIDLLPIVIAWYMWERFALYLKIYYQQTLILISSIRTCSLSWWYAAMRHFDLHRYFYITPFKYGRR